MKDVASWHSAVSVKLQVMWNVLCKNLKHEPVVERWCQQTVISVATWSEDTAYALFY